MSEELWRRITAALNIATTELNIAATGFTGSAALANFCRWFWAAWEGDVETARQFFDPMAASLVELSSMAASHSSLGRSSASKTHQAHKAYAESDAQIVDVSPRGLDQDLLPVRTGSNAPATTSLIVPETTLPHVTVPLASAMTRATIAMMQALAPGLGLISNERGSFPAYPWSSTDKLPPIKAHNDKAMEARANEPDEEFKRDFDFMITFFRERLPAYGDFYEGAMTEWFYGGHSSVQETKEYINANVFMPQAARMARYLKKRINGKIGLTGHGPVYESTDFGTSSLQIARRTLNRIYEIQERKWMTLAEFDALNSGFQFSFGYRFENYPEAYPEQPDFPFRPVFEGALLDGPRDEYEIFTILYTVGSTHVESIPPTKFKTGDAYKRDFREHKLHDRDHYWDAPRMPDDARQFLRQVVEQIRLYKGFEIIRSAEPKQTRSLLNLVLFDLTRERDLPLDPAILARVSFDTDRVCAQILSRFANGSYRLPHGRKPSPAEVTSAIRTVHDYICEYDRIRVENLARRAVRNSPSRR